MRRLFKCMLRMLMRLLFRVSSQGDVQSLSQDTVPNKLLIIANHESFLDGLILGLFLPTMPGREPVFVVHTGVAANRWFRVLLKLVDYLAVDPTNPMGMKKVIRLLESGRPVVIFPEGRLTTTGSLMKVYEGPAFVAAKTGATILPVRLDGPARSYFSRLGGRYPRRVLPRITLSYQPVTRIAMPDLSTAKLRRRKAGEALRRLMQEMVFASRPRQVLFGALLDAATMHGRSRRLVEDTRQVEYSYGDVIKASLGLGKLIAAHTQPGERVGVLLPNVMPTLATIFGLSAFGRVPAMLNYTAGTDGMQAACTAATLRVIVTSRAFIDQAKLADKIAGLQNIRWLYLEDLREQMPLTTKLWLLLMLCAPQWVMAKLVMINTDPENAAVVLFTSGSEGKPKGVVLSHRALLANIAQVRAVINFSVDDKILNALPLFHSFGLTAGGLLPLLTGANVFLYPSPLHYRVIPELAYDRNCTVLLGTSTFLGNYAKFAHPYDFYCLRYVIAGAEKLAEPVRAAWFEKFGIRIFEGYGATETAPVLAVNTPMAYRTGTVGQLLPGIRARLEPVPGIERGGLLEVSGPNLMSGYLRVDAPGVLQPPPHQEGSPWYSTGDVVEFDDDDFIRIVGRVKRFAKVAGEMVSLEVVEKLAAAASPAFQHAASTQPDAARGESIVLFTTDSALSRDTLQAAARTSGYAELAVPRKISVVAALPLLGTGKLDYVTLKQWAEKA